MRQVCSMPKDRNCNCSQKPDSQSQSWETQILPTKCGWQRSMCSGCFFALHLDMIRGLCNVHLLMWTEMGSSVQCFFNLLKIPIKLMNCIKKGMPRLNPVTGLISDRNTFRRNKSISILRDILKIKLRKWDEIDELLFVISV